ncbi:carbohydrate ABC transporter permease [Paenibacillus sp. MBLB4367]|uniref:carbohydrate ABC transporter permease n=1 Tax=Paenibacillus sp. MBLB4367 TaxID=3384767 RepID=UPI0039083ED5
MITYKSDRLFQFLNGLFLAVTSISMVAPLFHLLAVSLSSPKYADAKLVGFWPKEMHFGVYREILQLDSLWRALGVSVYICVVGTTLFLLFTTSFGYALSRSIMPGRKIILRLVLVTLVFSAGLIPNYMVIKSIGFENTLWALTVPSALSAFYVIIMKTFFQGISSELFDSAKIDGAGEFRIYSQISIPLSVPILATLSLYNVVSLWNSYFNALIFIRDKKLYPLQVVLRSLIVSDDTQAYGSNASDIAMVATPEMMKAGIILFATVPILLVYPFIQKYFVQGTMLGSLKE